MFKMTTNIPYNIAKEVSGVIPYFLSISTCILLVEEALFLSNWVELVHGFL